MQVTNSISDKQKVNTVLKLLVLDQYENYRFESDSLTKMLLKLHKIFFFSVRSVNKLKKQQPSFMRITLI